MKNANDAFVKYLQSDTPQAPVALMQFIYNNKITQSNIEFSVKGVKSTIHSNIALDIFFNKISQPDYKLPSALLESLAEDEQALFLEAPFSAAALENLRIISMYKKRMNSIKIQRAMFIQLHKEVKTKSF